MGTMSDIITVHKKTTVDISADKYLLELDKDTTCPRCKYKLERAKKLLAKIPRIDKLDTLTICNHCQTKVTKSCQECREIANTFIASKMHKNKILKEVLLWLSNVESILEKYEKLSHMLHCTGSHLYTDCLRYISSSPNLYHQPEIGQLLEFNNWSHSTVYPTKNHFSKKILIIKCPLEIKSESALLYVHDNKIECNNKMTQLKLCPYKYLEQLKSISKPFQRAIEMKEEFHDCEKLNLHDSLQKVVRRRSIEISKHTYSDRNFINKTYKDKGPGIISQEVELKLILSNNSLRKDRTHMSSPTQHSKEPLQKDFSYFFIKKTIKDQISTIEHKSSAELLRQFQNKLDTKVEIEEREKEEKRLKKIEEHEKWRLFKAELERKKLHKFKNEKSTIDEDDDELKDKNRIKKKIEPEPIIPKLSVKNINDKDRKIISDIPNVKKTLIIEEKRIETEQKSRAKKKIKLLEKVENEKFQTEIEDRLTREKNEKQRKFERELRQKKDEEKIAKWQTDKGKTYINAQEIKRMLKEQIKQNESKSSSQQKGTKREIAANRKSHKDNQDNEIESKTIKEPMSEKQEYKRQKEVTELKSQGINMNQIEIRTPSSDDLILQLVKLKQSHPDSVKRSRPKRLSQLNISSVTITAHKSHKNKKEAECIICNDSELELDLENIVTNNTKREKINDIIIGGKILKCKPRIEKEFMGDTGIAPLFFKSTFKDDNNIVNVPKEEIPEYMTQPKERKPYFGLPSKYPDQEVPKGVIRYALSDRSFIEKGWTMLPTEKVVRKMNVYHMRPAHPEFDWFEHNKNKKLMLYDTGEKLAEFNENGGGRWFYRNGNLALDYYDAEEINAQQRFVIYSSGEPDERGRSQPLTILAIFDYLGNGIVFDHTGKIRLKYNQTEGVILDRSIGPVSHWKWHTLNDPPVLQQVMIDIQMAHKDPEILKLGGSADDKAQSDNEEMLAIEFDNFIKEKSKKLSQKFKPFQIKMKALKINDHFSLKVLDQATVYLIFRDGTTNLKINIGMVLDHQDIIDTDTAEVGEVSNSLEKFPARTDSLAALQRSVAYAQRVERVRVERDRWLRPTELHSSADRLIAGISRPLRPPICVCDTSSTVISANRCKKPATYNLYYDTKLT